MSSLFIFDANSLISAALTPESINRKALDKAIKSGELAVSNKTMDEFTEVLFRQKFDKYFIDNSERWAIIDKVELHAKLYDPEIIITDCRDPKDNKYLELAIAANAACIISGDKDLLILHPFRGIPILNAANFISKFNL